MTNTKFRKRALLSSVAMLLVALVALGSATFAWFSTRTTADASTLVAKTTTSSNLQISQNNNGAWVNSLTFANANAGEHTTKAVVSGVDSLTPVTFDGADWKTATAGAVDQGYVGTTGTPLGSAIDQSALIGAYAMSAPVFVKYGKSGDAAFPLAVDVTITSGNSPAAQKDTNYARVAIVPITDSNLVSGAATSATYKVVGPSNNDFSSDPTAYVANATPGAGTTVCSTTMSNVSLGTLTAGTVYGYQIYAYYEGTDLECIDANSDTHFTVTLNFKQGS